MSQYAKFNEECQTKTAGDDDPPPKRTAGRVCIQEHPKASSYYMEDQNSGQSSIFQSNIFENMTYLPIQNQGETAASEYCDPNPSTQSRFKRFIFNIPAVAAGDASKKVIRTKITFNLRNLLKQSVTGSDEINQKFVNFSESDVEPLKKVSKNVVLTPSKEMSVEDERTEGTQSSSYDQSNINESCTMEEEAKNEDGASDVMILFDNFFYQPH